MLAPKPSWPFEGFLAPRWVLPSCLAVSPHLLSCVPAPLCVCVCVHMFMNSLSSMLGNDLIPGPPSNPAHPSMWPRAPRHPATGQPLLGSVPSASYTTPPFTQTLTRGCPDFYLEDEETEVQGLLVAAKVTGQGAKGTALTCLYLTTE